jgi:predicted Zn finger-like uncharacterized protein
MSIAFTCPDCGKSFKVADDLAGRKVKCGGCGVTIQIANVIGITAKPASRGRSPVVEDDGDWQEDEAPARKRSRSRRDDDIESDDEPEDDEPARRRPTKRKPAKKKSAIFALLLAAVALVVLLGATAIGGVALWWFWPSSSDLLTYAPDNSKIVVIVNWDKIESSKAYETISKESKDIGTQFGQEFPITSLKKAGISQVMFAGADSVSWNAGGGTNDNAILAVKTKDKITADDIKNDPSMKRSFKESSVGKYTLWETGTDAFCVIDNKRVVFGKATTVRAVLQRDKKPDFSANLKAAMDKADLSKGVAVALDSSGSVSNSPFAKELANMELEWAAIQADVGTNIALTLTVRSKSEKGANEIKKKFDDLLTMLKSLQAMAPGTGDLWAVPPQTSASGSTFMATATLKSEAIAKVGKNQQQNFDFFNQPPGKPGGNPPPKKK